MLALIYQAASDVPGDNGQPLQFGTHAATVLATSPVRLLPLYVPESEAAHNKRWMYRVTAATGTGLRLQPSESTSSVRI